MSGTSKKFELMISYFTCIDNTIHRKRAAVRRMHDNNSILKQSHLNRREIMTCMYQERKL